MTENKRVVERYIDGFRKGDHEQILSCLTDDVEWDIPGAFQLTGKDAFDKEIENEAFVGKPSITLTRLTEENDVVAAEGFVRSQRKDGDVLTARFCDVFVMRGGRIRRLITYLVVCPLSEAVVGAISDSGGAARAFE
jgi:ketosteroid isomerase-like protein